MNPQLSPTVRNVAERITQITLSPEASAMADAAFLRMERGEPGFNTYLLSDLEQKAGVR